MGRESESFISAKRICKQSLLPLEAMQARQLRALATIYSTLRPVQCVAHRCISSQLLTKLPRVVAIARLPNGHTRLCSSVVIRQEEIRSKVRKLVEEFSKSSGADANSLPTERMENAKTKARKRTTKSFVTVGRFVRSILVQIKDFGINNGEEKERREMATWLWQQVQMETAKPETREVQASLKGWIYAMMCELADEPSLSDEIERADNESKQGTLVAIDGKQRLIFAETLFEFAKAERKDNWVLKCPFALAIANNEADEVKRDAQVLRLCEEVLAQVGGEMAESATRKCMAAALARTSHWHLIERIIPPWSKPIKEHESKLTQLIGQRVDDRTMEYMLSFGKSAIAHRDYETFFSRLHSHKQRILSISSLPRGNHMLGDLLTELLFAMLESFDRGSQPTKQQRRLLVRLFEAFVDARLILEASTAESLHKKLAGQLAQVSHATIADEKACTTCRVCATQLPRYAAQVNADRFDRMRSTFLKDVLVRGDVYLSSDPNEFRSCMNYLEQADKFSYVIDAMNMMMAVTRSPSAQSRIKSAPWSDEQLEQLLSRIVLSHAARLRHASLFQKRKADDSCSHLHILLVAHRTSRAQKSLRSLANRWKANVETHAVDNIIPHLHLLFVNPGSADDCYSIYAALNSGSDCFLVSNDTLADHIHKMRRTEDFTVFLDWLLARQISVIKQRTDRGTRFQLLYPDSAVSSISVHRETENRSLVHIPFYVMMDLPARRNWLCLQIDH